MPSQVLITAKTTVCCGSPASTTIWYRRRSLFNLDLLSFRFESSSSILLCPLTYSLELLSPARFSASLVQTLQPQQLLPRQIRFRLYIVSAACLMANTFQLFRPMPDIWWVPSLLSVVLHTVKTLTALSFDVSFCMISSSSHSGFVSGTGIVFVRTVVLLYHVSWYTIRTDPTAMCLLHAALRRLVKHSWERSSGRYRKPCRAKIRSSPAATLV